MTPELKSKSRCVNSVCHMNFLSLQRKQLAKLPGEVGPTDLDDRVDLRDVPLVTIDGEDARDFDDAVYCTPVKVGREKAYR